jgi:Tetratricopeptide repeat
MKLTRPRFLIPLFLLLGGAAGAAYLGLFSRGSIFVSEAEPAYSGRLTIITLGPYPQAKDLARFKREGGVYVVSLLDPSRPDERVLLARETMEAQRFGLVAKNFPAPSTSDHTPSRHSSGLSERALQFLKHLNRPAYVYGYLGGHRVDRLRGGLIKAGIPAASWTGAGTSPEDLDLAARLAKARSQFAEGEFAKAIETLQPVTAKNVDVFCLRGWSHYRLGLITDAAQDFRQGLALDPQNPRSLEGLGYCYLQQGEPVMAQRRFDQILAEAPGEESALVGEGLVYLALGNKQTAEEVFRKVLAMDHSNAEAAKYLRRAESE